LRFEGGSKEKKLNYLRFEGGSRAIFSLKPPPRGPSVKPEGSVRKI